MSNLHTRSKTSPLQQLSTIRPAMRMYLGVVLFVYLLWLLTMTLLDQWGLFSQHWPISLTMTLGSIVAGATAEGGAAIAFPVFTKLLHIEPSTARTFGLLIQSVGMSMAALLIVARRVPFLPKVVLWVSLGGIMGQIIGTMLIPLPPQYTKILFTFVTVTFGAAMAISRWGIKLPPLNQLSGWNSKRAVGFSLIGVLGGIFAANTGSGIDMLTFIVLTLLFGINEKVGTPTTIIIMALNSIVGALLHAIVLQDVGIAADYWLVAIPIVIVGAPFGTLLASRASRDGIIIFLLTLIGFELFTTLWLVPFNQEMILVSTVAVLLCAIAFGALILTRKYRTEQSKH